MCVCVCVCVCVEGGGCLVTEISRSNICPKIHLNILQPHHQP